jgi:superfamily II DNA helicase RecQ
MMLPNETKPRAAEIPAVEPRQQTFLETPLAAKLPEASHPAKSPEEPRPGKLPADQGVWRTAQAWPSAQADRPGIPTERTAASKDTQSTRERSVKAENVNVQTATGVDEALLGKLKELRREIAKAASVPAYIVFSDASLRDMCRKRPVTGAAFLEVSGVGEVKRERYGEAFTKLIREYEE